MKKSKFIIVIIILFVFGNVIQAETYTYEDEEIRIELFKGWEVIPEDKYIFEGKDPTSWDEGIEDIDPENYQYSFLVRQEKILVEMNKQDKSVELKRIKENFKDQFFPILISIIRKTDEIRRGRLETINTADKSFRGTELSLWEKKDVDVQSVTGAYYFFTAPVGFNHETFLLLPNDLKESKIYFNFDTPETTLIIDTEECNSIKRRIELLKAEIARLEDIN